MKLNSCFIIPVYPPHYPYLNFLNSFTSSDSDIFLILSYKSDLDELDRLDYKKNYKTIILEEKIGKNLVDRIIAKNVIITFKKYYALNILKDSYSYLATCDSEIEFIKCNSITSRFKQFCDKRKLIGSVVDLNSINIDLAKSINKGSTIFFEYEEVREVSDDFRFYFWFSDIPIYDSEIISEYLDFINFEEYESFVDKIDWYFFDYISYGYYCLLFKNYSKINIKDYGINRNWSLESIPYAMYKEIEETTGYSPLWAINNTWQENKEQLIDKIILSYHLNDGRYTIL